MSITLSLGLLLNLVRSVIFLAGRVPNEMAHAYNPSDKWRQEDGYKFKASLAYKVSTIPTRDK